MLLLDTQAAIWWLLDDPRLSSKAAERIASQEVGLALSVASIWELEIKRAKGKYKGPALIELLPPSIAVLDINAAHAITAARLPPHHADPFDRMIVAQAITERRTLVSSDAALSAYDVRVVW